jgi:hypothetical protein
MYTYIKTSQCAHKHDQLLCVHQKQYKTIKRQEKLGGGEWDRPWMAEVGGGGQAGVKWCLGGQRRHTKRNWEKEVVGGKLVMS